MPSRPYMSLHWLLSYCVDPEHVLVALQLQWQQARSSAAEIAAQSEQSAAGPGRRLCRAPSAARGPTAASAATARSSRMGSRTRLCAWWRAVCSSVALGRIPSPLTPAMAAATCSFRSQLCLTCRCVLWLPPLSPSEGLCDQLTINRAGSHVLVLSHLRVDLNLSKQHSCRWLHA